MTDISTSTVAPLTADEQTQLAALQARATAAAQAKADAAIAAVRDLVASDAFKAGHVAMENALQSSPKDTELSYAVQMMDRMAARYPA